MSLLNPNHYTSGQQHHQERQRLFRDSWLLAGHISQLDTYTAGIDHRWYSNCPVENRHRNQSLCQYVSPSWSTPRLGWRVKMENYCAVAITVGHTIKQVPWSTIRTLVTHAKTSNCTIFRSV